MSLKRIVLRDFIIVSELDLELQTGFTVLTGATGAGKSILIDALQLVTGGRADVSVVREGANRTEVSAEFDRPPALAAWLDEAGFAADNNLLLRRTLDSQGKSRAWINGSPATATQLRSVGEQLLDIYGQHAWQSLTRADAVRGLLDAYAQVSTEALSMQWHHWRAAKEALARAHTAQSVLLRERERLVWQISELEKLAPTAHEWPALNSEHARLSNAQALLEAAQSALQLLVDNDNSACSQVGNACEALQHQAAIEPAFANPAEVLNSCLAQLEDTVHSVRAYLHKTELDPQRLSAVDERMGLWVALSRRYKCPPEALADLLGSWRLELLALEAAADLQALEKAHESTWQNYLAQAHIVTQARQRAAPQLSKTISAAMQTLGMQGGQFLVQIKPSPEPLQSGLEDVDFLVAGHAGSTPRPIQKIASGGELSRIALAIAVTTSQLGTAQTLIFDEVDAGVGGAVAETLGCLLRQLGLDRQVLAVTHLPQVAACANHHLVVHKALHGTTTLSSVAGVAGDARVGELARMLGGERVLASTLAHAREMLALWKE